MDAWDDDGDKNDPRSCIYDDYGYQRYVSNFNINTVADCQQLLVALSSLSSSVEQYTVAQKTAPMFAYYIKTHVLLNADVI